MICSSVNLDRFIVRLLVWSGLYLKLEEVPGLRSTRMQTKPALAEAALAHIDVLSRSVQLSSLLKGAADSGTATES
jgi:hypothetical protein